MCISVVGRAVGTKFSFGEQWGQRMCLEKGKGIREGREGAVGLASGRKTRKQGRRKVKNTPDSR